MTVSTPRDQAETPSHKASAAVLTIEWDARRRSIQLDKLTIHFKLTAPNRLYWAGRPAMRVVQALYWLKDMLPSDRPRVLKRLTALLADPAQGDAIRQDLLIGFSELPAWMQELIRKLPGCDPLIQENPCATGWH